MPAPFSAANFTVTLTATPTTVAHHPTLTTTPGALITIDGGPNATANIPGPHSDSADFYGIFLALLVIVAAIAITRVVFGWRGGSRRASPLEAAPVRPPLPQRPQRPRAAEPLRPPPRRSQDPWEPVT